MENQKPLAFIGLGIMGQPMAGHLLKAGSPLTVFSRTKSKADPLITQGAKWANSAAEAAKSADIIFFCLPDTPDVQSVINQILPVVRAGQIIVDHSTISPSATRTMAKQLREKGATLLDAPISGGDVGAKNATLSIMIGGNAEAFSTVDPYLKLMGKTITHCGPSGAGQLTKLTNQILVTLTNLATCEALTFATQNGLDPQKTLAALGGGAGSSWQFNNLGPRMLAGDFAPGFMIDLQLKDLRLVEQAAVEAKLKLAAVHLVHQLFQNAQQDGDGRAGTQALFKAVQKLARANP
ncbi:MAG TPA: NAD(P)-dependent oxidoreductase [Tepidisphaeraceae bacterium]|jgi:3-hydroxyisobutyrate dehydrogenase